MIALRTACVWLVPMLAWAMDLEPTLAVIAEPNHDRMAVLVGAGTYDGNPAWNLSNSQADLSAMSKALAGGADIAAPFQIRLSGNEVRAAKIEKAIAAAGRRLIADADGNALLVVYWSGHAFTAGDGGLILFTSDTESAPEGGFKQTVTRDQILGYLEGVRAERAVAGVRVRTVCIHDVCRIEVKAVPAKAVLRPGNDWAWFGTAAGEYSLASQRGDSPSAFTAQLAALLPQQARQGKGMPLDETALAVAQAMAGTSQKPELLKPAGEAEAPTLVRPLRVRPVVRLVDAASRIGLASATVSLDGGPAAALAGDQRIALTLGAHTLRAEAPGYLANTADLEVTSDYNGQALVIPLHPTVVVVRGRFAGGGVATVTGLQAEPRDGVHVLRAALDGAGAFELVLPGIEPGLSVNLPGGTVMALPTDPALWPPASFRGTLQAPMHLLNGGAPIAPKDQVAAALAAAQAAAAVPRKAEATPSSAGVPAVPATAPVEPTPAGSTGGDRPRIAVLKSAANLRVPVSVTLGQWPLAAKPDNTPPPKGPDGHPDLSALGSVDGQRPLRWDATPRVGRVVDVSGQGSAPGDYLAEPSDAVSRAGRALDLRAAGTAPGIMPLGTPAPIPRNVSRPVLDLTAAGTFPGIMPLAPIDRIPRAEVAEDLEQLGSDVEVFSIPDELKALIKRAVTP
jgi:hypothetical protein